MNKELEQLENGWRQEAVYSSDPTVIRLCLKHADELAKARASNPDGDAADYLFWSEGVPPKWFDEWFIAKTTHGEKMVVRSLPEEYAYDYTTADGTYIKRERVSSWMQFPDGQFKPLGVRT